MAAKVVSFINFKGGVGKTASAVNISACLAKYHDKKTLVIDTDPQSNSSLWLMGPKRFEKWIDGANTIFQLFKDLIYGTHHFDFDKAKVSSVVRKKRRTVLPNLDLLPATYRMISLENDMVHAVDRFGLLHRGLKFIKKEYDYILIDCPPNLYSVTKNALYFSDYYIIPAIPDFLSNVGLEILVKEIKKFLDITIAYKSESAKLGGILFTRVQETIEHNQQKEFVSESLRRMKKEGIVNPTAEIFPTEIRNLIAVAEASSRCLPLCIYRESVNAAIDYKECTDYFVSKI